MQFHTKRYDIVRLNGSEYLDGIAYEINLRNGFCFSDGTHLETAEDYQDLLSLIKDIRKETV